MCASVVVLLFSDLSSYNVFWDFYLSFLGYFSSLPFSGLEKRHYESFYLSLIVENDFLLISKREYSDFLFKKWVAIRTNFQILS